MGSLKDQALKTDNEDIKSHQLTDHEAAYLRLLNMSLSYHTLRNDILTYFLMYICTTRLGYPEGANLQFEFDFEKTDNVLIVRVIADAPEKTA